jgi:hypothetical protein
VAMNLYMKKTNQEDQQRVKLVSFFWHQYPKSLANL